jgi:hypothetical protein
MAASHGWRTSTRRTGSRALSFRASS